MLGIGRHGIEERIRQEQKWRCMYIYTYVYEYYEVTPDHGRMEAKIAQLYTLADR